MQMIIFFIIGAIAFIPLTQAKAEGGIVLNEIMYDLPGTDDPHEWVELWNSSANDIDVTDWKFNDGSNHILNAPPQNGGQGSLLIPAGGYAVLTDDAATFLLDHSGFSGTVIDTVMSLNNTADALTLIDASGSITSSISYTNTGGAKGNGRTLERDPLGTLYESFIGGGTPGTQNSSVQEQEPPPSEQELEPPPPASEPDPATPPMPESQDSPQDETQQDYSEASLLLSELLPDPTGSDTEGEFIEIANTGTTALDVSLWQLDDSDGNTTGPWAIPTGTVLKSREFLAFYYPQTKLTLNNKDGDMVRLIDPSGRQHDAVRYNESAEGLALARFGDSWDWTNEPTPNNSNQKTEISDQNESNPANTATPTQDAPEIDENSKNKEPSAPSLPKNVTLSIPDENEASAAFTPSVLPFAENLPFIGAIGLALLGGAAIIIYRLKS